MTATIIILKIPSVGNKEILKNYAKRDEKIRLYYVTEFIISPNKKIKDII